MHCGDNMNLETMENITDIQYNEMKYSGVFLVNFEHISHLFLVFLFLTLNK